MKSGLRGRAALLLLAATAFLLLAEKASVSDPAREGDVTNFQTGDVQAVVVQNSHGKLGLYNLPGGVKAEEKAARDYSQEKLRKLVYAAAHLSAVRAFPEVGGQDYGFSEPAAKISLLTEKETLRLKIGRECPLSDGYYLKREESGTVYVLAAEDASPFLAPKEDFFDLSIFPESDEEIERLREITLSREGAAFSLRCGDEGFFLTEPAYARLSREAVGRYLLNPLKEFYVDRYAGEETELERFGLDKPDCALRLKTDREEWSCIFKKRPDGSWYCANTAGSAVGIVKEETAAFLLTEFSDLMEGSIYSRGLADLTEFSAHFGDHHMRLRILGEGEELILKGPNRECGLDEALQFYHRIKKIPPSGYVKSHAEISSERMLTMTFCLRGGGEDILEFYPSDERNCAVAVNGKAEFTTYTSVVRDMIRALEELERRVK